MSANSHWIHVFDLGMRDEERKAKKARRTLSNNGETRQRMTMREGQDEADWSNNTTKILKGHAHNIPSISFLDDPSGNWLVGTSIDGMVIVWDIERKEIVSETRLCDGEYAPSSSMFSNSFLLIKRQERMVSTILTARMLSTYAK